MGGRFQTRMWRNWQTRQVEGLVDLTVHGGSSPPIRTISLLRKKP